jgi:hypothetical protein
VILSEIISGSIEKYDYSSGLWVQVLELNNSNVVRADAQRQCTNDDCFQIGGCFSATMNIVVKIPPPITNFQVRGCRITLVSNLAGAIGVFFVTNSSRNGRFFTLSCHDAIAWTETSSFSDTSGNTIHNVLHSYQGTLSNTAQGWMNERFLTKYTNLYIACATGISNLLTWEYFDTSHNIFDVCNHNIQFGIDANSGRGDTDCPRDFYKYLAEISFGFVYATPENGHLTLGQFAESKWGVAEIQANEIEYDSADFADYNCYMRTVTAYGTDAGGNKEGFSCMITPDFSTASMFDIIVENNPFLDGSYQDELAKNRSGLDFLGTIAENFYLAFYRPAEIVQQGYGFLVSPFKCTVHGQHTFHLGQKVLIHHRELDTSPIYTHDSIITKICWSLYGGQTIMCCGGDSRTLSQTLQNSKGDKVRKDLQNHCDAIKRRTVGLSQAEYDALTDKDDHTLYCII